jgi:LPXTG-motif cell wall-anchored protein
MGSSIPLEPINAYAGWLDIFKKKKKKEKDPTMTGLMIKSEKEKLKDIQQKQKLATAKAEREEAEKVDVLGSKVSPSYLILIAVAVLAAGGYVIYKRKKKRHA